MKSQIPQGISTQLTEAAIISQKVIPYLRQLGFSLIYPELSVSMHGRRMITDVAVFLEEDASTPHIVVEVKRNLPSDISIIDPAVQQAFSFAAAYEDRVRYLLITDGDKYYWFERSSSGQTLKALSAPPRKTLPSVSSTTSESGLSDEIDPERFSDLIFTIFNRLREERVRLTPLRPLLDVMQLLVAKLQDEKNVSNGIQRRFSFQNYPADSTLHEIEKLYMQAMQEFHTQSNTEIEWSVPKTSISAAANLLAPYSLSPVSTSVRGDFFRDNFAAMADYSSFGQHYTPVSLAKLMVTLAQPSPRKKIIDPACGTAGLLIEVLRYMESRYPKISSQKCDAEIVGVELICNVAHVAAMNLFMNDLPPAQIISADSLTNIQSGLGNLGPGKYDIVLMDPPIGTKIRVSRTPSSFSLASSSDKINSEVLFLEQAINLLKPGGQLVCVLPDSLLAAKTHLPMRKWLLDVANIRAMISLPAEAFIPVGGAWRATILLIEKCGTELKKPTTAFISQVSSLGYDRSGQLANPSKFSHLSYLIERFLTTEVVDKAESDDDIRVWSIDTQDLTAERLDVAWLDPQRSEQLDSLTSSPFPIVKLHKIVKIISGRNVKGYVDPEQAKAILIQAGAVRELEIDLSNTPYISVEEHAKQYAAHIQIGDILVTTTGKYLGRAAVVEDLPLPAVASSAVTILRLESREEIDPFFIATVINSSLGRKQVEQLQAVATAQPYIRRSELGNLLIPLPPLAKQREIAQSIKGMLKEARELEMRAGNLDQRAKELVVYELLGEESNE